MYNLLLINPHQKFKHYATQSEVVRLLDKKAVISPLSLTFVAALTPQNFKIRIIDEQIEKIPENIKPDIVGITTLSNTVGRAYEIADRFEAQGIPVVLGGPHATFAVEEGLQHATSIIVGEADGAWEECLKDFEKGELKKSYRNSTPSDFKVTPMPRWDLVDTNQILSIPIQISRGCPYDCEFCVVTKMFGRKVRFRDIDNVVEEIERSPKKTILFVDDHFTINKKYLNRLLERIEPLCISWVCQTTIDIGEDPGLLKRMAVAGCEQLLVGFESLNSKSLESTRKFHNNIDQYKSNIRNIHAAGISILASFVIGFDHDQLDEPDKIVEFAKEASLPFLIICFLGSSPGTDLRKRLCDEGRWYGPNPDFMGGIFPTMHYMNFSQTQIYNQFKASLTKAYSWKAIRQRVTGMLSTGAFIHPRKAKEFSFAYRMKILARIVYIYMGSKDPDKRQLARDLRAMVKEKTVSIDKAISILISMHGLHNHVNILHKYSDDFMPVLAEVDKGSWRDMRSEK
jgi:radical SAM superfamily enzyme YgiQ (UPF0313 family)